MLQYIFGYDVAQRYIQLLSQYVILMKGLIDAQVAGNPNVANQQIRELYKNADEQAGFLALNNPFWNRTELRNLMYTFNSLIIEQITALLGGNYQRNIDAFDRLLHHSDTIGNYATQGLFNYLSYYSQNTNSK